MYMRIKHKSLGLYSLFSVLNVDRRAAVLLIHEFYDVLRHILKQFVEPRYATQPISTLLYTFGDLYHVHQTNHRQIITCLKRQLIKEFNALAAVTEKV